MKTVSQAESQFQIRKWKYRRMKRMLLTAMWCGRVALAALGATVTWQGGDGDWSVASNWGGVKPKDGDTAVISDSSTVTVTTDEAYLVFVNLTGGATLEMQDGGKLNLKAGDRDFGIASVADGDRHLWKSAHRAIRYGVSAPNRRDDSVRRIFQYRPLRRLRRYRDHRGR